VDDDVGRARVVEHGRHRVVGGLLGGDAEFDHVQAEPLGRGQAVQFLGAGGVAGAGARIEA